MISRELASDGCHGALTAHQQVAPPGSREALAERRSIAPVRYTDPAITVAVERQIRAQHRLSARAFPEPDDALVEVAAARATRNAGAVADPGPDRTGMCG
ncbi:hypothetical protein [Streptomyces sp. NPDC001980]|uniref:hypothetical protein n=1 Tax=Streptomyces sp. NPDC001980 TaxID=3157126 RepID=UPI00332D546B